MTTGGRPFVLVVEDNPADAKLLVKLLGRVADVPADHIHLETDGEGALAYLEDLRDRPEARLPDLVFLDLNVPRLSGFGVLEAVRSDRRMSTLPVIALTSSGADRDVERAHVLRVNAYLRKPVDLHGFQEMVEAVSRFWFDAARVQGARDGG